MLGKTCHFVSFVYNQNLRFVFCSLITSFEYLLIFPLSLYNELNHKKYDMSIILGIDPGTTTTGFAVIASVKGKIDILEF